MNFELCLNEDKEKRRKTEAAIFFYFEQQKGLRQVCHLKA